MAFENIGIGGVLSFESKGAVANMTMAQRGFSALSKSMASVKANASRVGSGLSEFSLIGAGGLAAGGLALKSWVSSGMEFNKTMEMSSISIATILSSVRKTPLGDEIKVAEDAMKRLNVIAAEAPGETSDLVTIFRMMTGPIISAGGDMDTLLNNTKGVAIMAGALGRPFNQAGQDMAKLAMGAYEAGNDLHLTLKSMGLLTESTKEWKEMLPEQRLKRINEILGNFAASGERVGKTMEAQASTFQSIMKMMSGTFSKAVFNNMKQGLGNFNDAFFKNQDAWLARIEEIGKTFSKVVDFLIGEVKKFVNTVTGAFRFFQDRIDGLGLAIDTSVLKKVASIGVQFVLITTALAPIVTIVGFLGSKVFALLNVVRGIAGIFMALASPLMPVLAIAAALFLLFRRDGESVMRTFTRAWEYVGGIMKSVWEGMQNGIGAIRVAFAILTQTGQRFWDGIQPGLESFKMGIVGIVTLLQQVFLTLFSLASRIVLVASAIISAIQPGVTAVFNAIMRLFNAVVEGLNYLFPKIMSVLNPVLNVIMSIMYAVGKVMGKLLELLAPIIDGLTWLWQNLLVPIAGFVMDIFGPVVVKAFEAIGFVIETVLALIGKVIDGLKWLAEKAGAIIDAVGGAVNAVAGKLDIMGMALNQATSAAKIDLPAVTEDVDQNFASVQQVTHEAEIKAKQPDVNVNVDIKNKSTMCVNGRNLAVAQSEYETEVGERSGFNKTPWQTQRVQIAGVKPT